ncbi:MAG: hypothetical protein KBT13_02215, partial [Bacteroidales bacterium]|nr:hypothetical protein [Candidatus Sodaliphilus limicaballi]
IYYKLGEGKRLQQIEKQEVLGFKSAVSESLVSGKKKIFFIASHRKWLARQAKWNYLTDSALSF